VSSKKDEKKRKSPTLLSMAASKKRGRGKMLTGNKGKGESQGHGNGVSQANLSTERRPGQGSLRAKLEPLQKHRKGTGAPSARLADFPIPEKRATKKK